MPSIEFFRALEQERTQAIVRRDMDVVERLHAPEYQLVTPAGKIFSREDYLQTLAAGPFYAGWEIGDMDARISVAMAIVRYTVRLHFPSGRVLNCWHTDSYELRGQGWQAVWSQATEISALVSP